MSCFFFQAEDGIRDLTVTGVQTCALPIFVKEVEEALGSEIYNVLDWEELNHGLFTALQIQQILMSLVLALIILVARSEERRVGKECRYRLLDVHQHTAVASILIYYHFSSI